MRLSAYGPAPENAPTEIFLPEFHFPRERCEVEVSGGKWSIGTQGEEVGGAAGGAGIQVLKWWHGMGEQRLRVRGVQIRASMLGREDEEGYLDQCQQSRCTVM
jgi:hypothetical protein